MQIREQQLGFDGGDIGQRINPTSNVGHIRILEATHHVGDRIDFSNMGEKAIAEPLTLRSPCDQTGNVGKAHHGRYHPLRPHDVGKNRQARIRHRHCADMGIDGTKG